MKAPSNQTLVTVIEHENHTARPFFNKNSREGLDASGLPWFFRIHICCRKMSFSPRDESRLTNGKINLLQCIVHLPISASLTIVKTYITTHIWSLLAISVSCIAARPSPGKSHLLPSDVGYAEHKGLFVLSMTLAILGNHLATMPFGDLGILVYLMSAWFCHLVGLPFFHIWLILKL